MWGSLTSPSISGADIFSRGMDLLDHHISLANWQQPQSCGHVHSWCCSGYLVGAVFIFQEYRVTCWLR